MNTDQIEKHHPSLPETRQSFKPTSVAQASGGACAHDAAFYCSRCGGLVLGAEICRHPEAHLLHGATARPSKADNPYEAPRTANQGRYAADWPRDEAGRALVTFANEHIKQSVTLACFVGYRDPETGILLPYCPCSTKLPGWIVHIISGLTREQWKENAAHIPGRDSTHERLYLTVPFFRDYYFVGLHSTKRRQTRASRKWAIKKQHREAHCTDPACRKRHKR